LDKQLGVDVSVSIKDTDVITIMKKSRALLGGGLGFLAGVSVGALSGFVGWELFNWAPQDTETKYLIIAAGGGIGGLIGALVGGIIGSRTSRPGTIQTGGKFDIEVKATPSGTDYKRSMNGK
jgi:hypothetical protein